MSELAVSTSAVLTDQATRATSVVEAKLVHAAVAGEAGAARELVRLFHRPIYFYVSRLVGQAQDAEDVTQETFVKAFRALHKVDTNRPLLNWLHTIARRTALNHLRGRKGWTQLPPEPVSDVPGPRQEVEGQESVSQIWSRARRLLKAAEFEALWLRFGENLSVEETAQTTGRSISSIKTLIHRARKRLLTPKNILS